MQKVDAIWDGKTAIFFLSYAFSEKQSLWNVFVAITRQNENQTFFNTKVLCLADFKLLRIKQVAAKDKTRKDDESVY